MNLAQLRYVMALASTGSFTAAAADCFVAQPTLSNGVADLEAELGHRLFERTTRKVTLTVFGEQMLPAIAEVLKAQESLVLQAKSYLQPERAMIRIGASPLVSADLLNAIIEPFRQQYPDTNLVLREMNLDDLYRMLDDGQLDVVFGVSKVRKTNGRRRFRSAFLFEEPLMFVPREFQWQGATRRGAVHFKDISEETFVMVPDTCGLAHTTRALFKKHRKRLNEYSGQAMSYRVLEQWAHLGVGAAVLPKSKIESASAYALPVVDKAGKPVVIGFEAIWAQPAQAQKHMAEFVRHLKAVVPALVTGLTSSERS